MILSRQRVMAYAARRQAAAAAHRAEWPSLAARLLRRSVPLPEFSEEQIREVLRQVDKYSAGRRTELRQLRLSHLPREGHRHAARHGRGDDVHPLHARRAESLNNVVMDATPNAILVVDNDLRIQDISPSAGKHVQLQPPGCARQAASRNHALRAGFLGVSRSGTPVVNKLLQVPAASDRGQPALIVEGRSCPCAGSSSWSPSCAT